MRKVVFVGGIHGVGKTFFCKGISEQLNIDHFSASNLIAQQRDQEFSKSKEIEDINGNQNILYEAVNRFTPKNAFLLDGHFCLLDKNGEVTKIPSEIFLSLSIKAVLVLVEEVGVIAERLYQRDNKRYEVSMLEDFQKAELEYAHNVATILEVPYLVTSSNGNTSLNFIENYLLKGR